MTASESPLTAPDLGAQPETTSRPYSFWRRMSTFGTGFGIAISGADMGVAIVRARPSGSIPGPSAVITNFASRRSAEWGVELTRFLAATGEPHLAATVVLPREEVIVRTLRLPGVTDKDTASAIELQLDTLHPWDEEPIRWDWWRVSPVEVVVGIVRTETLAHYETLFSEAGIPVAAVTFSTAVIYAALRLNRPAPASIFCYFADAGRTEVYGESPARPCYSAEFSLSTERALALARAELRLAAHETPSTLANALAAAGAGSPADSSTARDLAFAAAAAASAPLARRFANLLPEDRRASHARTRYILPVILTILFAFSILFVFGIFPWMNERSDSNALRAEQSRLKPAAERARSIDRALTDNRRRIAALDDFRSRTQADLDVLNELARLLPPQVWAGSVEVYPDSIVIAGEADQAAPLLKLLDSSPLFQNSEFVMAVARTAQQTEQFRIKSIRRGRAGRTTP